MSRFDDLAATWEDNPGREARARVVADAISERLPLSDTWSVLDVGSGTGLLSRVLADRVGSIVLVDTSPGMTAVATDRIEASGLSSLSAYCLDVTREAPPGAPFDLAVSLLVLHHVAEVESFLESVLSRLVPGGYLAFSDLAAEDGTFHDDPSEDVQHHGFTPARLAATASSAGFVDVRVEEIHRIVKQRDGRDVSYGLLLLTARVPVPVTS
ncbi:MAG TPA: class I SAM-dependent methyltransferase, partial [Propionibacteriaceae bacterium]|nr:class I SAM-dependent methyltransferase [Propionibacteriaceae bacterium]